MKILDIGCGNNPLGGTVGLDVLSYKQITVQGDGMNLPFKDEVFERVNASQLLEHLGGREELPRLFDEVHRVLEPGGVFTFDVPTGRNWDKDPTHETKWTFETVDYFLNRSELATQNKDPESFPDYYQNHNFQFTLAEIHCHVWIHSVLSVAKPLSYTIKVLSSKSNTDAWIDLPLTSGIIKVCLQKPTHR